MKKLLNKADHYLHTWNWTDAAGLKFCLGALGLLAGLAVPARRKKPAALLAGLVFAAAYVSLAVKFLLFLKDGEDAE